MFVLAKLPGSLPTQTIPTDTDASSVAKAFAPALNDLRPEHFVDDATWRDHFANTGSMRTFYSPNNIVTAWKETSLQKKIGPVTLDPSSATVIRHPTGPAWINCKFSFDTQHPPKTSCNGFVSLVPTEGDSGQWKIWVLRTILQKLVGQPDADQLSPGRRPENFDSSATLDCIVIGGGQSGLGMAGRLKAMGLSYVMIDKNEKVGDTWKNRYESVRLHTVREYAHLPFDRTFDASYQEFLTADDIQRGWTDWVDKFGINVWQGTELVSGTWNADSKTWHLNIVRDQKPQTLSSRHIVLCVGTGGQIPKMPQYKNQGDFHGTILHSKDYKHARDWKGKQCIVIGSANTGHDIAQDMYDAGCARVTMVQRSTTYVVPVEHYKKAADTMYNAQIPTSVADVMYWTNPNKITSLIASAGSNAMADASPARYDALAASGFKVARHGDVTSHIFERGGGHYMDVGCSTLIAEGKIKVKSDSLPSHYTAGGLAFEDGSELQADVIVFSTGFEGSSKGVMVKWFGEEIAGQVQGMGGLDEEGEPKGLARPTGHPALWFSGISLGISRYHSRFIAMEIKADLLGTPLQIYNRRFPIGHANGKKTNGVH